jgi:hypothetical protein
MKTVKHLIYIFDIDVGAMISNGSTASALHYAVALLLKIKRSLVTSRKLDNFQKLDQHQEHKQQ